ncbi:flagellar filament capping protein FliD [Clostridium intestinale]|uniref:Flagellar hook-associated protein 2 n=1 Tax=Clostridium intestinale DSM 6191 TaxID=1121320 RepID=A0A1M5XYM6_9CLOT|nr:flagellar filament capping protein FliD [Clostridium intestinale]SHI04925.1 flagellar hook-associated protein 2 [Clostridium intestinale DSM 6191]
MASISSTTSTSYNRITGLATGMDTDAMVKQAMQPYQLKVDQAKQARDLQIFKQNLYRDTIKDLRSLFTKYTDISKPDSLLLTKNYGTSKFTSTNEGAVTAEGLSNAILGNYKVDVKNIAESAKMTFSKDDLLKFRGNNTTIDVLGVSVDIDLTSDAAKNYSENDIIKLFNDKMKSAGVDAKFSKSDLSGKVFLTLGKTGLNETDAAGKTISIYTFSKKEQGSVTVDLNNFSGEDEATFKVNGNDIKVDLKEIKENTELTDIEKKLLIKEKIRSSLYLSGIEVKSESNTDNITLNTKAGEEYSLSFDLKGQSYSTQGTTSDKKSLNEVFDNTSVPVFTAGKDANVEVTDTFNQTKSLTYSSNEFTVDGVKFKINDITTSPVTISGSKDTSKLVDKLKEFVKDYNEVIGKITTKLNEKKDLNYKPLTEAQKADMTDDQIEKWETKVKQGLLKRDNDLTSITSQLRYAFYDSINGTNLNITSLGIDFSNDVDKAGQLVIDEDKLSKALADNSEDVVKLFTQSAPSGTTDKKEIYNNSGIFQRIKTILNDSVMTSSSSFLKKVGYEGTSTYASNDITTDLLKREKQISLMESNLKDRQTNLYKKFAALEKAMNNYNSQSSWLSQQFGS